MSLVGETWRGTRALGSWFLGAPAFSLRVQARAKNRKEAQAMLQERARRHLRAWGLEVKVDGTPPPAGQGCVLTYNETSFADAFALHAVLWDHLERGSGADVFALVPFARGAYALAQIAMVPRGNRAGTDRVLAEMVAAVKAGDRIGWGAEGRFTGRDEVGRFKVGASLIAIRAGAPLVPVVFRGGHAAMHLGSLRARPGTIRVRYGAPLSTHGLAESDARALADKAQAIATEMYAALGP